MTAKLLGKYSEQFKGDAGRFYTCTLQPLWRVAPLTMTREDKTGRLIVTLHMGWHTSGMRDELTWDADKLFEAFRRHHILNADECDMVVDTKSKQLFFLRRENHV